MIANIDQVVVVFAAAKPEPNPAALDRFLVVVEANDLQARIVINKLDLVPGAEVEALARPYERAGYPFHFTSVNPCARRKSRNRWLFTRSKSACRHAAPQLG